MCVVFFFQSPLGLLWVFDGHWKSNLIIEITVVLTHGLSITQWLFLMFFGLFWMFFDNPVYLWCFDAWWWSVCVLFNIYIIYNMCIYITTGCYFFVFSLLFTHYWWSPAKSHWTSPDFNRVQRGVSPPDHGDSGFPVIVIHVPQRLGDVGMSSWDSTNMLI